MTNHLSVHPRSLIVGWKIAEIGTMDSGAVYTICIKGTTGGAWRHLRDGGVALSALAIGAPPARISPNGGLRWAKY
jgi:hypothetical protein